MPKISSIKIYDNRGKITEITFPINNLKRNFANLGGEDINAFINLVKKINEKQC